MKEKLRVDMKIWSANILTAIMCYGYALANCSIGVDDESIPRALSGDCLKLVDLVFIY